jgi:hypothetical protein
MRVHLQAVVWGTLGRSALKPTQWGWGLNNGRLVPVQIEGQVAPDSVLTVVRCKCKGDCSSALCSCKKHGLQCVTVCSNCHSTDCSNALPHNAHDIDEDSDVDDETVNTECTDVNYLPDFLWDHHQHHRFNVPISTLAWVGRFPRMPFLQTARSGASSCLYLNCLMSSVTHSFHVFLPLLLPLSPETAKFLQADTQSSTSSRSTCPNHLNLP